MAFIQNLKIPKENIQQFKIDSFYGGLNNVKSPFELSSYESPDLLNVMSFEDGSIETRPGSFKYMTTQFPEEIKSVHVYEYGNTSLFLASSDTKLYSVSTSGGTYTELCSIANPISGVQYESSFFFVDGEKFREFDGTSVYEIKNDDVFVGVATAGAATTITLPETANATDDYYNGWTLYISNGTGVEQTRIISDYVGATRVATVPDFTVAPNNTSSIYLTRRAPNVVYVNETDKIKTYTPTYHEFADTYKGLNNIEMASVCRQLVLHKNRLVFALDALHPNIVYYTDIDNMYYVPTNEYQPAITNDADYIKGCYSFNDVLTIFKGKTIFAMYGNDHEDFEFKEVTVPTGTVNIKTVCKVDNYLFYFGSDGKIYSLYDVRTDYKKMLAKSISETIDIIKAPVSLYPEAWANSHATHYKGYYMLFIDEKILVYKVGRGWFLWQGFNPNCFITYNNALVFADESQYMLRLTLNRFYVEETFVAEQDQTEFTINLGYIDAPKQDAKVYINNVLVETYVDAYNTVTTAPCNDGDTVRVEYLSLVSYNDNGNSYISYWNTGDTDFNYPRQTKQLKNIYIDVIPVDYWRTNVILNAYIDYYDIANGMVFKTGISLFGVTEFGERFMDKDVVAPIPVPINRRGKIVRFKISAEGVNQPFKIFNINGEVTIKNK